MSIKKISEMTGVSVATVSRVLRDPNHKCKSSKQRDAIFKAAREINYVPNESARKLKTGFNTESKTYYISVLLTRISFEETDPFFDEMLRLTEIEIRKNNCIVANVWQRADFSNDKYSTTEELEKIIDGMYRRKENKSDGIVIIGKCSSRVLKILKKYEKNIVSINRNSTNYEVDEILCDGKKIAMIAINHLIELGHRKIGYVGDCHNETRFLGYQKSQIDYNLETDIDYIFDTKPSEESGYKAMEYFLGLNNPPTAIYCANDILAIGMLKYLNKRRSRFYTPSIISSDNIAESQYTSPMLTTISLPKDEMVRFAIIFLLDRINGGHRIVSRVEMEGTLIVRDSCHRVEELTEPEYYI
jgi:DNA-binding LacI/PurR family transcriptional regulator